jgi:hypothetical protein
LQSKPIFLGGGNFAPFTKPMNVSSKDWRPASTRLLGSGLAGFSSIMIAKVRLNAGKFGRSDMLGVWQRDGPFSPPDASR